MSRRIYYGISVSVCIAVSLALALAQSTPPITGQWTISGPVVEDRVQLTIRRYRPGSEMSSSSSLPMSQLSGLTRAQLGSPTPSLIRFDIVRDAGTLRLEGYLQNGSGGGNFTFAPNPGYAGEMRSLGYSDFSDENVFRLAIHDVSTAYVRSLIAGGIRPESTDKLITMRIHGVSVEFVNEMTALGYKDLKTDKLVTMRIHGVTTSFIREIESLGFGRPPIDKLVTMRIHGITADYIRKAQARGFNNASIDELVRLRIHGIL